MKMKYFNRATKMAYTPLDGHCSVRAAAGRHSRDPIRDFQRWLRRKSLPARLRAGEAVGWAIYKTRWLHRQRPYRSTGIHGGGTCGYGRLSGSGFWQFPVRSLED
jgi:hypothetical protein